MEANTQNFIAQLREVRVNLQDALRNADNFEYKLLGPRPSDKASEAQLKQPAESVASLLSDLTRLSQALMKLTARHHEIVGEFSPVADCPSPTQNRYA